MCRQKCDIACHSIVWVRKGNGTSKLDVHVRWTILWQKIRATTLFDSPTSITMRVAVVVAYLAVTILQLCDAQSLTNYQYYAGKKSMISNSHTYY
jgi:hypothetical protein